VVVVDIVVMVVVDIVVVVVVVLVVDVVEHTSNIREHQRFHG
jgi:hypothetical protein